MKPETKNALMRMVIDEQFKEQLIAGLKAKYTSPEYKAAVMKVLTKKWKGNLHDQWIDFKYWFLIWKESLKMTKSYNNEKLTPEQAKIMSAALFEYPWIFDMMKTNNMADAFTEGLNGEPLEAMKRVVLDTVISTTRACQNILLDPKNTVLANVMLPTQIYYAMGLKLFGMEQATNVVGMMDQHSPERFLDAMYNLGLPDTTCTYSTQAPGLYALGEYPTKAACMISSSSPCEAHFQGYTFMADKCKLPMYWIDLPYEFSKEEGLKTYVEDLKGLINFLEETTGHGMNWSRLKDACERTNEIFELERQRWEFNATDCPPMPDDIIWLAHMQAFHLDTYTEADVQLFKKLVALSEKAYEKRRPAVPNIKYKTIFWCTPSFNYPGIWSWLERCWGVLVLNDLESYGTYHPIDTSSNDSMLMGLADIWCHGSMVRHLRGPVENWVKDLDELTEMYRPDFVMNLNHNECRGHVSMSGYLSEWSRKKKTPVCEVSYNFYDTRICSRQGIRDQISSFMSNVMHAEPLDKSLLIIDDEKDW